jgi:molybdopterin molybdotransferase
LDFYKVAIKPGKPLTLGRRGNTVVLGLPGNPVSAQLTFALFGLPLLRRMQGGSHDAPRIHRRTLTAPQRQKAGRRGFYVATATDDHVTPLRGQASGSIASLALANALVVVPEDSTGHDAGETADVLMLDEL